MSPLTALAVPLTFPLGLAALGWAGTFVAATLAVGVIDEVVDRRRAREAKLLHLVTYTGPARTLTMPVATVGAA